MVISTIKHHQYSILTACNSSTLILLQLVGHSYITQKLEQSWNFTSIVFTVQYIGTLSRSRLFQFSTRSSTAATFRTQAAIMTYSIRSGVRSRQAWQIIVAFVCMALVAGAVMVRAADPDPLQDFCVADLSPSAPRVNGFPCKDRANVTSKDFLFTDFRTAGSILKLELGIMDVVSSSKMLIGRS